MNSDCTETTVIFSNRAPQILVKVLLFAPKITDKEFKLSGASAAFWQSSRRCVIRSKGNNDLFRVIDGSVASDDESY